MSGARITLVAAVGRNGVIGGAGKLPWRLRSDLQRFKAVTMGKPMLMSDVGGASELVLNGFNGYVYPRGDVSALTNALRRVTNIEVCERLGARSRERVCDRFSFGAMRNSYERLLAEVVKQEP